MFDFDNYRNECVRKLEQVDFDEILNDETISPKIKAPIQEMQFQLGYFKNHFQKFGNIEKLSRRILEDLKKVPVWDSLSMEMMLKKPEGSRFRA